MHNLVDRLQDGYRECVSDVFSEESKRNLKEMGNIELYELSETVRTTRCPICLKHSKYGTIYCGCGKCLIPPNEHEEKIRKRIDILAEPLYVVKRGRQGQRHDHEEWQYHHWKAFDAAKKLQQTRVYVYCKTVERRCFPPRHSAIPWMVS